jgi:hypothetical protein
LDLLLSSIWLAVVIWLIARAFQQRGLLQSLEPAAPPLVARAPNVAVIVPARDILGAPLMDRCGLSSLRGPRAGAARCQSQ